MFVLGRRKGPYSCYPLIDADRALKRFLVKRGIPHSDLTRVGSRLRFASHGNHWTERGHRMVTEQVRRFLLTKGLVP